MPVMEIRKPSETTPPATRARTRYPWGDVPVGGSMVLQPNPGEDLDSLASSVRSSGWSWVKKHAPHLMVSVHLDRDENQIEAWLLKRPKHGTNAQREQEHLPTDFPHRDVLISQGFKSFQSLRNIEDLTALPRIGPTRAKAIREALERYVDA